MDAWNKMLDSCILGTDLLGQLHVRQKLQTKHCYFIQSQCTDTGPTSTNPDPIMPSIWHNIHESANFQVDGIHAYIET